MPRTHGVEYGLWILVGSVIRVHSSRFITTASHVPPHVPPHAASLLAEMPCYALLKRHVSATMHVSRDRYRPTIVERSASPP